MPIIKPGDPIWIRGKMHTGHQVRFLDEAGHELHQVSWINTDAQTFGQLVVDDENRVVVDPTDPNKVLEIVRYGRVRIEPR